MIVGLCGTSLAGREAVASYLLDKGYGYYSFNTELKSKDDAEKQRKTGEWVKDVLEKMDEQNVVIDGIASVKEVELLRGRKDFRLLGIYSPIEVKFDRAAAKELLSDERKDNDYIGLRLEELSKVFNLIDKSIVYPAAESTIKRKVDEVVKKL